jgi:hypothetical protein
MTKQELLLREFGSRNSQNPVLPVPGRPADLMWIDCINGKWLRQEEAEPPDPRQIKEPFLVQSRQELLMMKLALA